MPDASPYQARVARFREALGADDLAAAIVLSPSNVYYFSGFRHWVPIRPHCVVIPNAAEAATFLVPKIEYEYAVKSSWIEDIRYYVEFPEPGVSRSATALLRSVLSDLDLEGEKLGIELDSVSVDTFAEFQAAFPEAEWKDVGETLRAMRSVKDPHEIELLRIAGRLVDAGWQEALNVARAGMPEYEIALAARTAQTRFAAEEFGEQDAFVSPIVDGTMIFGAGGRSSICHLRPSARPLEAGELVTLCFCCNNDFKGYRVGFSRLFSLGEVNGEVAEVHKVVDEAQRAALEEIRPGVTAARIDEVARARLAQDDLAKWLTHRTGRGFGLDVAEAPELKEGDETILQPGMSFSVEPAVYVPGKYGIQIETPVVVTSDGYESLTAIGNEIVVI